MRQGNASGSPSVLKQHVQSQVCRVLVFFFFPSLKSGEVWLQDERLKILSGSLTPIVSFLNPCHFSLTWMLISKDQKRVFYWLVGYVKGRRCLWYWRARELHYLDHIYLPDEKQVCLDSVGCRCLQLTIFSYSWKIGGELGTYFNILQ